MVNIKYINSYNIKYKGFLFSILSYNLNKKENENNQDLNFLFKYLNENPRYIYDNSINNREKIKKDLNGFPVFIYD